MQLEEVLFHITIFITNFGIIIFIQFQFLAHLFLFLSPLALLHLVCLALEVELSCMVDFTTTFNRHVHILEPRCIGSPISSINFTFRTFYGCQSVEGLGKDNTLLLWYTFLKWVSNSYQILVYNFSEHILRCKTFIGFFQIMSSLEPNLLVKLLHALMRHFNCLQLFTKFCRGFIFCTCYFGLMVFKLSNHVYNCLCIIAI